MVRVITESSGDAVLHDGRRTGFTRSGVQFRPTTLLVVSGGDSDSDFDEESTVGTPSHPPIVAPLLWDMEEVYGATKGPRRYSGAVNTIDLDDFIQEFDTWCDMQTLRNAKLFTPFMAWKGLFQHLEGPPMDDYHEFRRAHVVEIEAWRHHWSPNYVSITYGSRVGAQPGAPPTTPATPSSSSTGQSGGPSTSTSTSSGAALAGSGAIPVFNPVVEFFAVLRENYQGVRTDKLRSLQDFQRKTGESLREAYTRMRRLITVTKGVTEAQAVQCWYGVLDRELRRRVRDATLLRDTDPTLAIVFTLSERIELNMVNERVVTTGFAKEVPKVASTSTSQPTARRPQRERSTTQEPARQRPVPSYAGQQTGCWTCGGDHAQRDCPDYRGQTGATDRPLAQQR